MWWWQLVGCEGGTTEPDPVDVCAFEQHPDNPLIEAPSPETFLGDPSVLSPEESPDGRWHLFANSLLGIHEYVSDDGVAWLLLHKGVLGGGNVRPFLLLADGKYHLFHEYFAGIDLSRSVLRVVTSEDLETWSEPVTILEAELPFETEEDRRTVSNPYVTVGEDGRWWLYYSTSQVFLEDTDYIWEPRYVAVARADSPTGPYEKDGEPLFGPDPEDPWRNLGAGSLKRIDPGPDGRKLALNNGIYVGEDGTTGSAIRVLESDDGLDWHPLCDGPVLAPDGEGWDTAFVYAFDTAWTEEGLNVWFNARDGWAVGSERIGLATAR